MPVKRRSAKRRIDPIAEADAWACLFDCEYDFFDDLPELGVPSDAYGRVGREVAEEAWHRLGHIFLADRPANDPQPDGRLPWALKEFGQP